MTLSEFLKNAGKYQPDTYGDLTDDWGVAYCSIGLTKAGEEKWKDLMNLEVEWKPGEAIAMVRIAHLPDCGNLDRQLRNLFGMAAGYCSEEDYKKYVIG